jgi:formate dehydrogenase major subunit
LVFETARAEIAARAKVTDRMRPLRVDGRLVHQVALPWHWGYTGTAATGDATNDLISLTGDPNVTIEDTKSWTCNVRAGRRTGETTARLAGKSADLRIAPDEDHPAEEPKIHG